MFHKEKLSHIIAVALLLIAVQVIVLAEYFGVSNRTRESIQNGNVCTQEAKICPDGSTVSRTGPNCEFAECAQGSPSTRSINSGQAGSGQLDVSSWKTYHNEEYGFEVKYPGEWNLMSETSTPSELRGEPLRDPVGSVFIQDFSPNRMPWISIRTFTFQDKSLKSSSPQLQDFFDKSSIMKSDFIQIQPGVFVVLLAGGLDQKTFDRILSTFKFIDQNSGCGSEPPASCAVGYKLLCRDGKWGCRLSSTPVAWPWENSVCGNGICEQCEDMNSCCNYPCNESGACPPPTCLGWCSQDCTD